MLDKDARNRDKAVDSIPSTDRWANGMNEPRIRTISSVLCGT